MDIFKELKTHYFISTILYTLLGIVLLCFPKITTKTICYAIGIILILVGIGYVISYITKDFSNMYSRYELVIGVSAILGGISIFLFSEMLLSLLPVLLGIAVLLSSIIKLQRSFDMLRAKYSRWWIFLIFSLLSAGLGVLLISHAFKSVLITIRVIGAVMIWNGITDIITGVFFIKKIKEFKQDMEAIDVD